MGQRGRSYPGIIQRHALAAVTQREAQRRPLMSYTSIDLEWVEGFRAKQGGETLRSEEGPLRLARPCGGDPVQDGWC